MKIVLLILSLISFLPSVAQQLTADSIQGKWICKEVTTSEELTDVQMKNAMAMMQKGFINSRFNFRENGIVRFTLSKDAPAKMKELAFLDNNKWTFEPITSTIQIHPNIMSIKVKDGEGFLSFLMEETPLVLRMERE